MRNKVKLKKLLWKYFLVVSIVLLVSIIITMLEYKVYMRNFNLKISGIASCVIKKYPDISKNEVMDIINSKSNSSDIFKKYNIDIYKDSVILENDYYFHIFIGVNLVFILLVTIILVLLFLRFNARKDREINKITKYIEQINQKNYKLDIDEISEDELSILKSEIYKTTIMLKEQAENLGKDKNDLKMSLSDISHQLKTPLTSILIMLDNLLDDEGMDSKVREEFIFDIKREINNINFLVQNLLKLSKLDTNTVKFVKVRVSLDRIIKEAIKKVECVSDLKNVKINLCDESHVIIRVDEKWQVEAFSNILKNCIEHSRDNSRIDIFTFKNKVYSEIVIQDYGMGIDKRDLPHIFERFYKGNNSNYESMGIGLALSRAIIEKSGGKIFVESKINEGTKFIIRYYEC